VGGSNTAAYDAEDRLLQYGTATYTYTPDGELKTKTIGGAVTTYDYDAVGNLRSVVLPGGTRIDYVIDAQNRRVGEKVDGTLTRGWLYADPLRVAAELDGSNQVVSQFVYGSRGTVPDYLIRNGVTYRILSDHLGSARLVVNVADGTIAESRTYDEFGRVLSDSNPGFIPFGFAGGLYDADTGLTRFGARDYEAGTGRWTAKEPLGFGGGDTNFYAYVANDPINWFDASGLAKLPSDPLPLVQNGSSIRATEIPTESCFAIRMEMSLSGMRGSQGSPVGEVRTTGITGQMAKVATSTWKKATKFPTVPLHVQFPRIRGIGKRSVRRHFSASLV
jgi:RHS repeat-associated protein